VRRGGAVIDCAVLVAVGVGIDRRRVLRVGVSLSEAEVHWRELLASLTGRGLIGVRLVVSDDHAGLKAARRAELPGVARRRRQFPLQRNVVAYVPQAPMRREVARAIRGVFTAPDRERPERVLAAHPLSRRAPADPIPGRGDVCCQSRRSARLPTRLSSGLYSVRLRFRSTMDRSVASVLLPPWDKSRWSIRWQFEQTKTRSSKEVFREPAL